MELIIADFVTHVTTASTQYDHISFSFAKMPLSLRVLLDNGGRELTEDEKMRIPVIAETIAACKARASIDFCFHREEDGLKMLEDKLQVTLGEEAKDLFQMFPKDSDIKPSVCVKFKPWKDQPYQDLVLDEISEKEEFKHKDGRTVTLRNVKRHNIFVPVNMLNATKEVPVPVSVQVLVHFPESLMTSPETHPPARRILEEGLFSDVTIVAANGAEIKGHRNFLAVHSPVLTAAFRADMLESRTGRLDMSDVSEAGIWTFLRYLYYGDLGGLEEDPEKAFQVLYAAHKYHVEKLETEAIKCLMDRENEDFNAEVAFKIYMFVRNLESISAVQLKTKVLQILITKIDEMQLLPQYNELFDDPSKSVTVKEIFKDFAETRPL